MTREEVFGKIIDIINDQFGVSFRGPNMKDPYYQNHLITESTIFNDDLGADSLDKVEMVMAIEDMFDFQAPDEEIADLNTMAQLLDYVMEKIQ
jgi:acyl carrier protein